MFTSAVGGDWNRAIRANRWRKIQVKCCSVECRLHRGPTVPFSSIEPHPISNKPSLNMLHPDPVVLTHRHQPPTYARCDQDPWIVPWEMIFPDPFIQIHNKSWRALFWAEIHPEIHPVVFCAILLTNQQTNNRHEWKQNVWCLCWLCRLKHWRYKTSYGDDGVWFQRVVVVFLFGQKIVKFHFI